MQPANNYQLPSEAQSYSVDELIAREFQRIESMFNKSQNFYNKALEKSSQLRSILASSANIEEEKVPHLIDLCHQILNTLTEVENELTTELSVIDRFLSVLTLKKDQEAEKKSAAQDSLHFFSLFKTKKNPLKESSLTNIDDKGKKPMYYGSFSRTSSVSSTSSNTYSSPNQALVQALAHKEQFINLKNQVTQLREDMDYELSLLPTTLEMERFKPFKP